MIPWFQELKADQKVGNEERGQQISRRGGPRNVIIISRSHTRAETFRHMRLGKCISARV